jgi:hypothetical protein
MAMDTPLPIRATSVRWRAHRPSHTRKTSAGQPYGRSPGHVGRGSVVPVTSTLDSKESDGVALSRASSVGGGKVIPEEADVMAQTMGSGDQPEGTESRFSKLLQRYLGYVGSVWGRWERGGVAPMWWDLVDGLRSPRPISPPPPPTPSTFDPLIGR